MLSSAEWMENHDAPPPSMTCILNVTNSTIGHIVVSDISSCSSITEPSWSLLPDTSTSPPVRSPSPVVLDITATTESLYSTESYVTPHVERSTIPIPIVPPPHGGFDTKTLHQGGVEERTSSSEPRFRSPLELLTSSITDDFPLLSSTPPNMMADFAGREIGLGLDDGGDGQGMSGLTWFMDPVGRQNFELTNTNENLASLAIPCEASPDLVSVVRDVLKPTQDDTSPRSVFEYQSQWQSMASLTNLSHSPDKENLRRRVSLSRAASKLSRALSRKSTRSKRMTVATTKPPHRRESTFTPFSSSKSELCVANLSMALSENDSIVFGDIVTLDSISRKIDESQGLRSPSPRKRQAVVSSPFPRPQNPTPAAARTRVTIYSQQ
jgi:hypothetical protein